MPKNNIGRTPSGTSRRRGQTGNEQTGDDTLVDLVEVRDQAQGFLDRNRNTILGVAFGLAAIAIGFVLYQTLYKAPRAATAAAELQFAQVQFERDSFQLALANPGNNRLGFLDIIDEYGGTPSGNLANYYAAVSYLNLGEYAAALDYMGSFKPNGSVLGVTKYGVMGDAESELGNFNAALGYYEDAVDAAAENYSLGGYYQNKLALLYRHQGQNSEALAAFEKLKTDYGQSPEAREADKFIALLEAAQ